jgi:hypothetical protein
MEVDRGRHGFCLRYFRFPVETGIRAGQASNFTGHTQPYDLEYRKSVHLSAAGQVSACCVSEKPGFYVQAH